MAINGNGKLGLEAAIYIKPLLYRKRAIAKQPDTVGASMNDQISMKV
jgi:hypothetical protein